MPVLTLALNFMELAACVAGFLNWPKIRQTHWRWFPIYLGLVVITEVLAEYFNWVRRDTVTQANIYRLFAIPLEFLFFFWLFYRHFQKTNVQKLPVVFALVYLLAVVVDVIYLSSQRYFFHTFSYSVGNVLLLVLLLMFFQRFSRSEEILTYKTNMMFWVCTGLMIFYVGALPFFGIRNTLYENYPSLFTTLWYGQLIFNYIMYTLFIISFIWGKPK